MLAKCPAASWRHNKRSTFLDGYKENFETLRRAFVNADVALVHCTERESGESVAVLAAINRRGEECNLVPFARMVAGDPYEQLIPPARSVEAASVGDSKESSPAATETAAV